MLMESIVDFWLALFNCGVPGVEPSEVDRWLLVHGRQLMRLMAHVWAMIALRMLAIAHVSGMEARCAVVETLCREGHASSLDVARDLLVVLLLVVVEIPVLPPCVGSLLP
jgi:hypothetical protein